MVKWERVSTHPDGWATKIYKGLVVSRRQFIAGTGASFFMPPNASAVDLDEILAGRTKLSFYWNKEESRFSVVETPEFSLFSAAEKKKLFDKEKEGLKAEWIWEVDPISLGVNPDILLASKADGSHSVKFTANGFHGPMEQVILSFVKKDGHWRVGGSSQIWDKKQQNFAPVDFRSFLSESKTALKADNVTAAGVHYALASVFDGQFAIRLPVNVILNNKLAWTLDAVDKKPGAPEPIELFGGQVQVQTVSDLHWNRRIPKDGAVTDHLQTDGVTYWASAHGSAKLKKGTLVLGKMKEFHLHFFDTALVLDPTGDTLSTEAGQAPQGSIPQYRLFFEVKKPLEAEMSEGVLKWENWGVQVQQHSALFVGEVAAKGELRRSLLPNQKGPVKRSMKTVVVMDVTGSGIRRSPKPSKGSSTTPEEKKVVPFDLMTRAGVLTVLPRKGALQNERLASAAAVQDPGQDSTLQSEAIDQIDVNNLTVSSKGELISTVSFVHVALSLFRARMALPDASYSELNFDSTALSLIYDIGKPQLPPSYVWLNQESKDQDLIGRFDLTRAQISASRHSDLLSLKFRFADLVLAMPKAGDAYIAQLPDECRVIAREPLALTVDPRPVLVVEFPPQHVMEQALFRRQPEKPPQADIEGLKLTEFPVDGIKDRTFDPDPRAFLLQLAGLDHKARIAVRKAWKNSIKAAVDSGSLPSAISKDGQLFLDFANEFEKRVGTAAQDQQIYVGPFGLDPDRMAVARVLAKEKFKALLNGILNDLARRLIAIRDSLPKDMSTQAREREYVTNLPLYGAYKEKFNETQIGLLSKMKEPISLVPGGAAPELEFRVLDNPTHTATILTDFFKHTEVGFSAYLAGNDVEELPDTVPGRLANPTRLAFRVNCGLTGVETGQLPAQEVPKKAFPFTLAGLTDWSRHELAVTRRAQRLDEFTRDGLLDLPSKRIANLNDADVLTFQGVAAGSFTTSQQRLSDIYAAMRNAPGPLETAIELPARLLLSPSQNAIWRTQHFLDQDVYSQSGDINSSIFGIGKPVAKKGEILTNPAEIRSEYAALWAVTLDSEAAPADVRAIHSPDFRPSFLWGNFSKRIAYTTDDGPAEILLPGNKPPPRGPLAPWLIGSDKSDDKTIDVEFLSEKLPHPESRTKPVCDDPAVKAKSPSTWSVPALIAYLCGRKAAEGEYTGSHLFRASLDAYDRHELVLLSSAYGLPVQAAVDENNQLKKDADQFASPPGYELMDLQGDTAIYRPRALDIRELTLTSVGGTFRHDTAFAPPAAAKFLDEKPLFNSLSIERWQHWVVLGRDIFTEVVYKGFLFPLGIRASLVKVTERTFLRNPSGYIKAYLIQRLFIRCGKPEKRFPALRQPNGSRQFPCERLTLLTVTTPDIIDPTTGGAGGQDIDKLAPDFAGRLKLLGHSGLIFWPRTALSPKANVRFSLSIDGRVTEMPLIFMDNTAVQDKDNIAAVVGYYNQRIANPEADPDSPLTIDRDLHLRSLDFGGQSLRYCEETRVGDSTIETRNWTIKAEGRQAHSNDLAGDNTDYTFDAQMQGAEQPPFYPAVETAVIVLKQVERFSGGLVQPVVAQFDGHYVGRDFAPVSKADGVIYPDVTNKSEIYMNFVRPVGLDMGTKGDRSGGMYRPGNDFVAMSRSAGPVGGKGRGGTSLTIARPGELANWATHFHYNEPPQKANSSSTDQVSELLSKATVLKQYFSGHAKLLGMIRMDKLIEFIGVEALPVLNEVVEYGASAMHQADAAAQGIEAVLRDEVLTPILRLISDLDDRWITIQSEYRKVAKDEKIPSLDQIFPEIGAGFRGLKAALTDAIATTDTIEFAKKVSRVYEAGQQLIRGLSRIASNPIGRINDALRTALNEYRDLVAGNTEALRNFIGNLKNYEEDLEAKLISEISAQIVAVLKGTGTGLEFQPGLIKQFDGFLLQETLDKFTNTLEVIESSTTIKADLAKLKAAITTASEIKEDELKVLVEGLLRAALKSNFNDLKAAVEPIAAKIRPVEGAGQAVINESRRVLGSQELLIRKFRDYLYELPGATIPTTSDEQIISAYRRYLTLEEYQRRFEELRAFINQPPAFPATIEAWAEAIEDLLPLLPSEAASDAARLGALVRRVSLLKIAVEKKDIKPIVGEALSLLTPIIGAPPVPQGLTKAVDTALNELIVKLRAWAHDGLDDTRKGLVKAGSDLLSAHGPIKDVRDNATDLQGRVDGLDSSLQNVKDKLSPILVRVKKLIDEVEQGLSETASDLDLVVDELSRAQKSVTATELDKIEILLLPAKPEQIRKLRAAAESFRKVADLSAAAATRLAGRVRSIVGNSEYLSLFPGVVGYLLVDELRKANAAHNGILPDDLIDKAEQHFAKLDSSLAGSLKGVSQVVLHGAITTIDQIKNTVASAEKALLTAIVEVSSKLDAVPTAELLSIVKDLDPILGTTVEFRGELDQIRKDVIAFPTTQSNKVDRVRGLLNIITPKVEALVGKAGESNKGFLFDAIVARNVAKRLVVVVDLIKASLMERAESASIDIAYAATRALVMGWRGRPSKVDVYWPGLLPAYKSIDSARKRIHDQLSGASTYITKPLMEALVIKEQGVVGDIKDDRLSREIAALEKLEPENLDDEKKRAALKGLYPIIHAWRQGDPSIFMLADQVMQLANDVLKGDLTALIDFATIRDEFEKQIKQLVPLRASLSYNLGGEFHNDQIDRIKDLTVGIFQPQKGSRLDIDVSAKVEFLQPTQSEFNVKGRLGPFSIKLIGDFIDAVTIKFHGADFTVEQGRSPHLQVYYDDFVIGKDLEFVQQLQSFLMPEKGSGSFLRPLFSPIGIEAGYGIALPIITLGTVSFSNISLNASLIIPFDGGDSRFRASLSRVDAPFTIAAAPFGGSGYFGIEANAEGVVGFDAAFEYGGATAFQFGPLKGIGRLMVGVYVRQTKVLINVGGEPKYTNFTDILGTFYAGGTASIWIFHFSASLYVRLGMSGGKMIGEATFTFSFSSGFVDFDFTVKANRTEDSLGSGSSFNRFLRQPYLVAATTTVNGGDDSIKEPNHFGTKRVNKTVCQGVNWATYKTYFHDAEMKEGEDFL